MRAVFFFLLLISTLLSCCSTRKVSYRSYLDSLPLYLAWNEDTTSPIKVMLFRDSTFQYSRPDTLSGLSERIVCHGNYHYTLDTFFLNYYKPYCPPEYKPYLVMEASRNYLIQFRNDSLKSIFLRRVSLGTGHRSLNY